MALLNSSRELEISCSSSNEMCKDYQKVYKKRDINKNSSKQFSIRQQSPLLKKTPKSSGPPLKPKVLTQKKKKGNCFHANSFDEESFFKDHLLGIGFESKPVNSLADLNRAQNVCSRRRRKPRYIDSEVELMMTRQSPERPKIKYSDIAPSGTKTLKQIMLERNKDGQMETKTVGQKNKDEQDSTNLQKDGHAPEKRKKGNRKRKLDLKQEITKSNNVLKPGAVKYPVLCDEELQKKFLSVKMTNNQKGRIRQIMRDVFTGLSSAELPDILNNKIQAIVKSSRELSDSELRKIRVLFNMLQKATQDTKESDPKKQKLTSESQEGSKPIKSSKPVTETEGNPVKNKPVTDKNVEKKDAAVSADTEQETKPKKKSKKPKRYVVFVGNLPVDVDNSQIVELFKDIENDIATVRIPPVAEGKKSAMAFVEIKTRASYEMALSKNHWMLGKRRINVQYTAQKDSKYSPAQIKAKQAKLQALQKKGLLVGSVSANRKRSQRRAKQRKAIKEAEKQLNNLNGLTT